MALYVCTEQWSGCWGCRGEEPSQWGTQQLQNVMIAGATDTKVGPWKLPPGSHSSASEVP